MTILEIIAAIEALSKIAQTAFAAGREDVTDAEVDAALADLGESRQKLVDAIKRAEAAGDT